MEGWISLHRKVYESDLWNDVTTFRLFIYLLLHASHKDGIKINGIELQRGQWIRSTRKLAEDLSYKEGRGLKKYSTKTINKCIHKLVDAKRVSIEETEVGTLFTILNYALYQDYNNPLNETGNTSGNEQETKGKRTVNNNNNAIMQQGNKKDINTSRSKLKFETHHLKLAELLFKKIKENNPSAKEPNIESWANTFRLMMERDKRKGKDIQDLILWSQSHHFWYKNILSADKLRNQFDRLFLEMRDEKQSFRSQPKLIATGKPDHIEVPVLPDDIDEQIDETLKELYGEE